MRLDTYQQMAGRTIKVVTQKHEGDLRTLTYTTKLAGEVGEVCELLGKHIGHGHDLDVEELEKELGDVLWYVAALATLYDLHLEDIAVGNIAKLKKRYPHGYSDDASRNREEYQTDEQRVARHFDWMQ